MCAPAVLRVDAHTGFVHPARTPALTLALALALALTLALTLTLILTLTLTRLRPPGHRAGGRAAGGARARARHAHLATDGGRSLTPQGQGAASVRLPGLPEGPR
eukprot:scaffold102669_cov64-Phaeocystis_antarctica.AAC.1